MNIPGYIELEPELKAAVLSIWLCDDVCARSLRLQLLPHVHHTQGVDEVLLYAVHDGAVMDAWSRDSKNEGSFVQFLGDPFGDLTNSLGMLIDDAGVRSVGLVDRCKRSVVICDDGEVKCVAVADREGDPAGGAHPDVTLVEAVLDYMKDL